MNNTLLLLAPAINVLVTGLFAGVVLGQYLRRRRSYQLYWSLALSMAFLATLAYIGMIIVHPTSGAGVVLFRSYYALGGAIMPAWLGLGSIALVCNKRFTKVCYQTLCLLSFIAVLLVLSTPVNMAKLHGIAGTPGTGTLETGPWLIMVIVLNTLGVVAVAGVALYSGWKLLRRQKAWRETARALLCGQMSSFLRAQSWMGQPARWHASWGYKAHSGSLWLWAGSSCLWG